MKRNLWLVSLLLVFGLGAMAPSLFGQAKGTVWSTATNTNTIRNEGDAEATGTITLTTSSSGPIYNESGFDITYTLPLAYYGTPPVYAVGVSCSGTDLTPDWCATNLLVQPGMSTTGANPDSVLLTFTNTSPYYGANGTSFVGTNAINIAVRVQAQGVAAGTPVNATVTGFYTFSAGPLTISSSSATTLLVGTVQSPATKITLSEGPAYVLTCIGVKDVRGTLYDNDFSLNIKENWIDALTSYSDEYNLENNDPTYFSPGTSTVYPTNGSDILITLSGVPPNVGIVGQTPVPCQSTDATAANYCAGGNLTISAPVPLATTAPYGSTQQFWYQVMTTNVRAIEWADFGFKLWSKGPLPPNMSYQIAASVTLTDLYPEDGSSSQVNGEMPYFTAPEPTPTPVVIFLDCVTKLLFPYINAYVSGTTYAFGNFGTGIVFSNTTWDPFALPTSTCVPKTGAGCTYPDEAKGSAVPQSGSCTLYLYPADESTTIVFTTPVISAGGQYAFDVATLVPAYKGRTGYGIAICNFQNGYGFAEIYDNWMIGAPTATLGYMAYILPDPGFYHRSPAGDGLGEEAIAPINMDLFWKKLKYLLGY